MPSSADLFLRTEPDGHHFWSGIQARKPQSRGINAEEYGLFLMFEDPLSSLSPGLMSHPPSCLDLENSLLTFPSHPTAWKEIVYAHSNPVLRVRSTAVALCVSNNPEFDCKYEKPDIIFLFTLSIVTTQGVDGLRTVVLFGNGVQIPQTWHPCSRDNDEQEHGSQCDNELINCNSSVDDGALSRDEWLGRDPRLKEVLDGELQRIYDRANRIVFENLGKWWNWKPNGHYPVRVGCCDAEYPGFREVRIACIHLQQSVEDDE